MVKGQNMKRLLGCCTLVLLSTAGLFGAAPSDVANAVEKGDKEAVRSLLLKKADVNAPQIDGTTALHWAVRTDDLATADLLIRAGAKVSAANRDGATPLLLATINGNAAMIEKLLKAGADVNATLTLDGDTALMMAARTGKVDAVKTLLDHGAQRQNHVVAGVRSSSLIKLFLGGGAQFPEIPAPTMRKIWALLQDEVEALEEIVGRDLSHWKMPPAAVNK